MVCAYLSEWFVKHIDEQKVKVILELGLMDGLGAITLNDVLFIKPNTKL